MFVFAALLDYWRDLSTKNADYPDAEGEVLAVRSRLLLALPTLRSTALTVEGMALVDVLAERIEFAHSL